MTVRSQQVIATIAVGNCPIPSALGDLGQERSVVRTQRFGQYLPDDNEAASPTELSCWSRRG
jgi:hypothetical protein